MHLKALLTEYKIGGKIFFSSEGPSHWNDRRI